MHKMMFVLTRTQDTKDGKAEVDKAMQYLRPRSSHPIPCMPERIEYRRASEFGNAAWETDKKSKKGKKEMTKKEETIQAEIASIWKAIQAVMEASASAAGKDNVVEIRKPNSILMLNELGSLDKSRDQDEQSAFSIPRHWPKRSHRKATIYLRTTLETKKRLNDLAIAQNKTLGEVIEELVDARYQAMRGRKPEIA